MKNKAASAQNNGAAFAAFRKNFEHLLAKHELCIVIDESEQVFCDLFPFWSIAMQTYFENLPRMGISLSAETNTRWLSQAMVIEIGDADGSGLPEECRPFIEYGERFFRIFFQGYGGGVDKSNKENEGHFSYILIDLAEKVLKAIFLKEAAMFASVRSDGRSACGTAGAQIIMFPERGGRMH